MVILIFCAVLSTGITDRGALLELPSSGGQSALKKWNMWVELIEGQCAFFSSLHEAITI